MLLALYIGTTTQHTARESGSVVYTTALRVALVGEFGGCSPLVNAPGRTASIRCARTVYTMMTITQSRVNPLAEMPSDTICLHSQTGTASLTRRRRRGK